MVFRDPGFLHKGTQHRKDHVKLDQQSWKYPLANRKSWLDFTVLESFQVTLRSKHQNPFQCRPRKATAMQSMMQADPCEPKITHDSCIVAVSHGHSHETLAKLLFSSQIS